MIRSILSLLLCGLLSAAETDTRSAWRKAHNLPARATKAAAVQPTPADAAPKTLLLRLGDHDTGVVHTRVRMDTWIIVQPDERITAAGSGDTKNWQIQPEGKGGTNLFHVQPSQANSRTNLNLRTSLGHYYSLLLIEDSGCASCEIDAKVFIESADYQQPAPLSAQLGYAEKTEKEYQKQVGDLKARIVQDQAEIGRVRVQAAADVKRAENAFRAEYPLSLHCSYRTKFGSEPFSVQAICNDGTFTYLKIAAAEMPSLYIEKDGKLALTQFVYHRGETAREGTYVVNSVIHRGELRLGGKRLKFAARG